MQEYSALAASSAVEGAFVLGHYNVAATVNAGPAGALVAGLHGVAIGRFGWADENGLVLNERTSGFDVIGLVVPRLGPGVDWRQVFYDDASDTWRIRQGLPLTMLSRGSVWARFPGGAYAGQMVFANVLDGTPLSGYSPDGELTRWSVVTSCRPGELAVISTWSMIS